jgi:heme-degrading monooxygenase HmoA
VRALRKILQESLPARALAYDEARTKEESLMICRIWQGIATPENAATYERIVRNEVIPAIEARRIEGFLHIDLLRRETGDEIEFRTIMWFTDLEAVKRFVGGDFEASHVPPAARAVLQRFDERAAHYQVIDRRPQGE